MKFRNNKKKLATLIGLGALPFAINSCGEKQLIDVILNSPCNQTIWANADDIEMHVKAESIGYDETTHFSHDSGKGNLQMSSFTDAIVDIQIKDKNKNVYAAVTFGPIDMTNYNSKLVFNITPGRINAFNVTTPEEDFCGSMNQGRIGHTATTLKDGRIMIIGGEQINNASTTIHNSTEFYDPASSVFEQGPEFRYIKNHAAVLLDDGRVLISGGIGTVGLASSTLPYLYIYNPNDNNFMDISGSTNTELLGRSNHTATKLSSGEVLFVGGIDSTGNYVKTAFKWNPADGSIKTYELKDGRAYHQAVLLPDDQVAIIGGQNKYGALKSVEIFKGDNFTTSFNMNEARTMASAVLLNDSTILVSGGYSEPVKLEPYSNSYPESLKSIELVRFLQNKSNACNSELLNGRAQHLMVKLPNDSILVSGGRATDGSPTSSSETITVSSFEDSCKLKTASSMDMSVARANHVVTTLPGGDYLFIGGQESSSSMAASAEIFTVER